MCYTVDPIFLDGERLNFLSQDIFDQLIWRQLGFDPLRIGLQSALDTVTRPLPLPLVDKSDLAFAANMTGSPQSVFQALLVLSRDAEQKAVDDAAPPHAEPNVAIKNMVTLAQSVLADRHDEVAGLIDKASRVRRPWRTWAR